jgi:L-lysine 6-transaminase
MFRSSEIPSADVHDSLRRHILVDGYPLVIDLENSKGSFVRDGVTGAELIDFYSFFASNPLGFNHPRMLDERTKERLLRTSLVKVANSDKYTTYFAEFVDTLSRTAAPPELRKYFFVEGGALAVENALKAAFDWKVRKNLAAGRGEIGKKILHLKHAFHGRSGYTMSLTNTDPNKTDYFPKFDWPRIPSPMIRFPLAAHLEDVVAREKEAVAAAEAAFDKYPHEIAGIIIEPIQSEGGDNHFRDEFFISLRRLADERDALLIYDEVQTGIGGTGAWWYFQHTPVRPDIVCFAKKMQVGGIMVGDRIDDVADNVFVKPGRINSTWGGGLVDMVRATRLLEIIVEEDLVANAQARGVELLAGLAAIQARHPKLIDNVRGRGLMCAFDLPDGALRDKAIQRCFADGMLVLGCGARSIRFRPALTIEPDIVQEGLRRLEKAVLEVEAEA